MDRSEKVRIVIAYGVNVGPDGGYLPVLVEDGRSTGHRYGRGESRDVALRVAYAEALERAHQYVGDWTVEIRPLDTSSEETIPDCPSTLRSLSEHPAYR